VNKEGRTRALKHWGPWEERGRNSSSFYIAIWKKRVGGEQSQDVVVRVVA
jgi:hypothetical protein